MLKIIYKFRGNKKLSGKKIFLMIKSSNIIYQFLLWFLVDVKEKVEKIFETLDTDRSDSLDKEEFIRGCISILIIINLI